MHPLSNSLLPYVVLISGIPGAGKTTLGWELSRRLHVPFLSRDDVKTSLHVTHRSADPNEVWRFAGPAFDIFFDTITRRAAAGVSLVADAFESTMDGVESWSDSAQRGEHQSDH